MPQAVPPRMVDLIIEAGRRLGMSARILDPDFGYLFELRLGERRLSLLGGQSPLNDAVASRIAQDKFYTEVVLRDAGYRTTRSIRCLRPGYFRTVDYSDQSGLGPALDVAREAGFPLLVKPNSMALGRDVLVVHDEHALVAAVQRAWEGDYIALVQRVVDGVDLRLDLLDERLLVGYWRKPVEVIGDGEGSLSRLLGDFDSRFRQPEVMRKAVADPVWEQLVKTRGWDAETVVPRGERIDFGSTVLNLNRWASARPIEGLPDTWLDFASRLARALDLRHLGIDLKVPRDLSRLPLQDIPPLSCTVIEVNGSPSLAQFHDLGYRDEAISAEMQVLQAMFGL